MSSSGLRNCEQCHQPWPKRSHDHDLRGFAWLDPLPRTISISNADLLLHDGYHGEDRFLFVEVKMPWEPPLQKGQNWLLASLAGLSRWTVRLLHGRLDAMRMHRVTEQGVERDALYVRPLEFKQSVGRWLDGAEWRDPMGTPEVDPNSSLLEHTHGWAKVDGAWQCVQDYYAIGQAAGTGCGALWDVPA